MPTPRRLLLALAAGFAASGLCAQTYVGLLDGSSVQSTFTTSTDGFQALGAFGWTSVSGVGGQVFGQTGGTSNDVLLGGTDFGNYEVEFNTSTSLQANSIYTLSVRMGFVSGGTSGNASYDLSLGTKNGGTFTALTADNPALETGNVNRSAGPTNGLSFGANGVNSVLVTVSFTTGASVGSDPIHVRWAQTASSLTGGADYFGVDNVTLSVSAIPEPSTYAAIVGGLALGGAMIRRRHRTAALNRDRR
jgi:hypothetical protein